MVFPSIQDLKKEILFEDGKGCIWLGEHRMMLLHAASFGALRSELIKSLGAQRAKGTLVRMGFISGRADARLAKQIRRGQSLEEMFYVGPQLHALEGVVRVEPIRLQIDPETGRFHGEFYWDNSAEADEHIKAFGMQDDAVCWNLVGYASGYTSEFMGRQIFYKELDCVGKGDTRCRIVGKPMEEWKDAEEIQRLLTVESIGETISELEEEIQSLRETCQDPVQPDKIIGDSRAMQEVLKLLRIAAECDVTVLMLGETGVGKDVFSNALHQLSRRRDKPFIAVNCASLPRDLVESELFGVEKGAYTGAEKSRPGRFERADDGVLFLDEIGELSEAAQAKLLRILQTGDVERVGGTTLRKVDVRLIAATNADLEQMVSEGKFRADLYYRLNIFPITIPPLRERLDDLPRLVDKFIARNNTKYGKKVTGITDKVLEWFRCYQWPGNVRELENVLERGVLLAPNHQSIDTSHLFAQLAPNEKAECAHLSKGGQLVKVSPIDLDAFAGLLEQGISMEEVEKGLLSAALQKTEGNVSAAARLLNIGDAQFRYRMKKYGIQK